MGPKRVFELVEGEVCQRVLHEVRRPKQHVHKGELRLEAVWLETLSHERVLQLPREGRVEPLDFHCQQKLPVVQQRELCRLTDRLTPRADEVRELLRPRVAELREKLVELLAGVYVETP